MHKLIEYFVDFDKHSDLKFKHLLYILYRLYQKFHDKIEIKNLNVLTETLIYFLFPSNDKDKVDKVIIILKDQLVIRSILLLLKEICYSNDLYIFRVVKRLISPLIKYLFIYVDIAHRDH